MQYFVLDINECIAGTSKCDADTQRINTKGLYYCICKPGHQGDGNKCEA